MNLSHHSVDIRVFPPYRGKNDTEKMVNISYTIKILTNPENTTNNNLKLI